MEANYELSFTENIRKILNTAHNNKTRLRFWFGSEVTGAAWCEENDCCGYIGFTGKTKTAILLAKSNSSGGSVLNTSIVKIVDIKTKAILYQHESFSQPVFTNTGCDLFCNGLYYGRNHTESSAIRYCEFMNGKRMSK